MMTFKQSMASVHLRHDEVNKLAEQGDKLALQTILYYRQAWTEYHRVHQVEANMEPRIKENIIKACDDYVRRELTVADLADVQHKFGHRVPKALQ